MLGHNEESLQNIQSPELAHINHCCGVKAVFSDDSILQKIINWKIYNPSQRTQNKLHSKGFNKKRTFPQCTNHSTYLFAPHLDHPEHSSLPTYSPLGALSWVVLNRACRATHTERKQSYQCGKKVFPEIQLLYISVLIQKRKEKKNQIEWSYLSMLPINCLMVLHILNLTS